MSDYKINPTSEAMKKILGSDKVSQDFEFVIKDDNDPITVYVQHFTASIVNKQEELMMRLITRVANEEFVNVTIDKSKLIEIFGKYTPKKVKRFRDGVECHCGACDKVLPVTTKYCPECGQKIDWDHEYFTEKRYERETV